MLEDQLADNFRRMLRSFGASVPMNSIPTNPIPTNPIPTNSDSGANGQAKRSRVGDDAQFLADLIHLGALKVKRVRRGGIELDIE